MKKKEGKKIKNPEAHLVKCHEIQPKVVMNQPYTKSESGYSEIKILNSGKNALSLVLNVLPKLADLAATQISMLSLPDFYLFLFFFEHRLAMY